MSVTPFLSNGNESKAFLSWINYDIALIHIILVKKSTVLHILEWNGWFYPYLQCLYRGVCSLVLFLNISKELTLRYLAFSSNGLDVMYLFFYPSPFLYLTLYVVPWYRGTVVPWYCVSVTEGFFNWQMFFTGPPKLHSLKISCALEHRGYNLVHRVVMNGKRTF